MTAKGYQLSSTSNASSYLLSPSRTASPEALAGAGLNRFTIFGGMVNDLFSSGAAPNYLAFSLTHQVEDGD